MTENKLFCVGMVFCSSGKYHQNCEVWSIGGIAPTIKSTSYKDPNKVIVKCQKRKPTSNK